MAEDKSWKKLTLNTLFCGGFPIIKETLLNTIVQGLISLYSLSNEHYYQDQFKLVKWIGIIKLVCEKFTYDDRCSDDSTVEYLT